MRCFANAARGVAAAFKNEQNLRIHCAAAYMAVCAGMVCRISTAEWGSVLVCCALVISAELFNTAIESLSDEVTGEYSPRIKLAKDASAGAVLVCAAFSAAAGLIIFLRDGRPAAAYAAFKEYPALWIILALSAVFWVKIIFFTWRRKNDR